MISIFSFCANGRNQAVAQNLKNIDADNQRFTKSERAPVWRQGFPRPETGGTLIIPLRSSRAVSALIPFYVSQTRILT